MEILIKWAVLSGVFMGGAALLPDVKVRDWKAAVAAGAVFGVANFLIGWLLAGVVWFAFWPINLLTVGLFAPFAANVVLLLITDTVIDEPFEIEGLRGLLTLAALLGIASWAVAKWL